MCNKADFNSKNLSPKRIYEGAAFGVPPLVLAGSATADFVASWESGIPLSGNIEAALVELILNGRPQIEAALSAVRRLPQSHFIHEHTYLDLLDFMKDNSTSPPSFDQPTKVISPHQALTRIISRAYDIGVMTSVS